MYLFLVYDVLTGDVKLSLRVSNTGNESREKCIRDVSWHPYENFIISTSVKFFLSFFILFNLTIPDALK
jgi:hypothetical protein